MRAITRLVLSRLRLWKNKELRGTVLATLLFLGLPGGMIAGTSAIKAEIENGPNRALTLMHPDYWVLQKGSTNVITSSFVPRDLVHELNQIEGVQAVGVVRDFRAVTYQGLSREAIVYSYNPEIPQMRPTLMKGEQADQGVVIDQSLAQSLGVDIGSNVGIAGLILPVDGLTAGTSSIGKEGVFISEEVIDKIAPKTDHTLVAVVGSSLPPDVSQRYSVYTQEEFLELNRSYWKNASGLAVTLMQTAGLFGTVILVVSLGATLKQRKHQIAMLRAVGASSRQVWLSEMLYMMIVAILSFSIQVLVALLVVNAANSSTPGFQGRLTVNDGLTGLAAVLVITLIFGTIITRRFVKRMRHPAATLASA